MKEWVQLAYFKENLKLSVYLICDMTIFCTVGQVRYFVSVYIGSVSEWPSKMERNLNKMGVITFSKNCSSKELMAISILLFLNEDNTSRCSAWI